MNTLQQEPQLLAEIKDIVHQIYMDEDLMGGAMKIKKLLATARAEVAQQCYLECLTIECGEGECARAIRTKFNLKGI